MHNSNRVRAQIFLDNLEGTDLRLFQRKNTLKSQLKTKLIFQVPQSITRFLESGDNSALVATFVAPFIIMLDTAALIDILRFEFRFRLKL